VCLAGCGLAAPLRGRAVDPAMPGPIVAGFLIGANIGGLTWRPVFPVNIVLCAPGLAAASRLLPAKAPRKTDSRCDFRQSNFSGSTCLIPGVSARDRAYHLPYVVDWHRPLGTRDRWLAPCAGRPYIG
jgi:MFS family permease